MPKKTFQSAKDTKNEVILQVKENQPTLLANCYQIVQTQTPFDTFFEHDKGHGRIEFRKAEIYHPLNPDVSLKDPWVDYVKTIIKVTRNRKIFSTKTKKWQESEEISFYLSSLSASAKVFGHAIRAHWGIENRNHYVKDETMGEDKSRIRKNPQNMAKLRSLALNMMRKKKVENIEAETYKNSLNINKTVKKYHSIL